MVFLFLLQHRIFGTPSEHTIDVQLEAVPRKEQSSAFSITILYTILYKWQGGT